MSGGERIALGKKGEDTAVKALKKDGYRIVDRNYRCRYGEIDIIAEQGGALVFIEVKTRGSDRFGSPEEGVDYRKQRHITLASSMYLTERALNDREVRFDVVSIDASGGRFATEIIKGAFDAAE